MDGPLRSKSTTSTMVPPLAALVGSGHQLCAGNSTRKERRIMADSICPSTSAAPEGQPDGAAVARVEKALHRRGAAPRRRLWAKSWTSAASAGFWQRWRTKSQVTRNSSMSIRAKPLSPSCSSRPAALRASIWIGMATPWIRLVWHLWMRTQQTNSCSSALWRRHRPGSRLPKPIVLRCAWKSCSPARRSATTPTVPFCARPASPKPLRK